MTAFVRFTLLGMIALSCSLSCSTLASAQITGPRIVTREGDRYATLEEQLINRLRATREDQQAYILHVVDQVREKKLDQGLVVAIEKYAMRRNRGYPFPFFERALQYEAAKRGLALPPVQHFSSTKIIQTSATTN